MKKNILSKKILYWYDNNKRNLPWRTHYSKKQKQYFILVSEFMLQQTQVKTVIPYFKNFIRIIPNLKKLSKVSDKKLMKCWQGLGYYSRARSLKKTSQIIIKKHKGDIPNNFDDLKALPGVGNYTASAILAIAFNQPYIPLDGNIERVLKRYLYLKKESEIKKDKLDQKKSIFGTCKRSSDYAQALMEIGALICKPTKPLCNQCPIQKKCMSFKKQDFELTKKNKKNINKYFILKVYKRDKRYLVIKNTKFNFLKNLNIFPMEEVTKTKKFNENLNFKISNMNMSIKIKYLKNYKDFPFSNWIDQKKLDNYILPTFTKKIVRYLQNN